MIDSKMIRRILLGEKIVGICPVCHNERELTIEHYISRAVAYRFLRPLLPEGNEKKIKYMANWLRNQGGVTVMCQSCNGKQEIRKRLLTIKKRN